MSHWKARWKWGFGGVRRELLRASQLVKEADQAYAEDNYAAALSLYEQSLTLFRELEHWQGALWVRLRLGYLYSETQDYHKAREHYEQAVSLARNLQSSEYLGAALNGLAAIASHQGDYAFVRQLCKECLQLWRDQENALGLASTYCLLGSIAETLLEAKAHYERALALCRERNNAEGIIAALCSLGHLAAPDQDNLRERACLEECLELCQASGNKKTRSYALNNLGNVERFAGNLDRAAELYRESLRLKQENGDEWAIAYTLEGCAALAVARYEGRKAARLFGAAAGIRERLGTPLEPSKQPQYKASLIAAGRLLIAATFESAWREGATLPLAQAIAEAVE